MKIPAESMKRMKPQAGKIFIMRDKSGGSKTSQTMFGG